MNANKQVQFSERQIEVLRCFGSGWGYRATTTVLGVCFQSIQHHKKKLLKKTKTSTLPALKQWAKEHGFNQKRKKPANLGPRNKSADEYDTEPDWSAECENCGASPIVPCTGLCGPCTFGEADTIGGNW